MLSCSAHTKHMPVAEGKGKCSSPRTMVVGRSISSSGKLAKEVERRGPYTKHTLICCSLTSDGWQVLVGGPPKEYSRRSYQIAHDDLRVAGSSCWSSGHCSLDCSSRRLGILLDSSYRSCDGGPSRYPTSSTAATATTTSTGAVGADDFLKSHVEFSRHGRWR